MLANSELCQEAALVGAQGAGQMFFCRILSPLDLSWAPPASLDCRLAAAFLQLQVVLPFMSLCAYPLSCITQETGKRIADVNLMSSYRQWPMSDSQSYLYSAHMAVQNPIMIGSASLIAPVLATPYELV